MNFYLKLNSLNYNTLQALMVDSHTLTLVHCQHGTYSPNTLVHTSILDTYTHQLLTLFHSTHLLPMAHTSPLHTTSHISHLMLYDTLSTLHHTHTLHLFILNVCWLGNQLEASSFFFLNTLFTKLLDYSINMWLSFTSTQKFLEISHRDIRKEHHGEISGMQENFLENFEEKQIEWNSRSFQRERLGEKFQKFLEYSSNFQRQESQC